MVRECTLHFLDVFTTKDTLLNYIIAMLNLYKLQRKSLTLTAVFEYHIEDNELFAPSWILARDLKKNNEKYISKGGVLVEN